MGEEGSSGHAPYVITIKEERYAHLISNIINDNNAMCPTVVRRCNRPETLLTSSIPLEKELVIELVIDTI